MPAQYGRKADKHDPVVSDREPVSKKQSAKQFRRKAQTTKAVNVASAPMRGGWRL